MIEDSDSPRPRQPSRTLEKPSPYPLTTLRAELEDLRESERSVLEALRAQEAPRYVISHGRLVAETRTESKLHR